MPADARAGGIPPRPRSPGRPPRALALGVIGVVLAVALGAFVVSRAHDSSGTVAARAATSTNPSSFALPRLHGGGSVRLVDLRGRPVVVNFFASWCTACRGEAPGFTRAAAQLRGSVTFVGVNSLETGDGAGFAHELGYDSFTLARDVDGEHDSGLHDALGRRGLPITAFYSASGRLLYVATGALPEDVLRARISDLFGVR